MTIGAPHSFRPGQLLAPASIGSFVARFGPLSALLTDVVKLEVVGGEGMKRASRPLAELSLDEACAVLEANGFNKCVPAARENEIDGAALAEMDSKEAVLECLDYEGGMKTPKVKALLKLIKGWKVRLDFRQ